MYSDEQVLNWTLTMDDLGVCTHNLCRENPALCQIFYPADEDRQLARNPPTLPRAKCMFCGHVAAIHKKPQVYHPCLRNDKHILPTFIYASETCCSWTCTWGTKLRPACQCSAFESASP